MPSAPSTSGVKNSDEGDSSKTEVVDEARSAFLAAIVADLSTVVVETKLDPGHDLWVRVEREAWADIAEYFHHDQQCRYFDWLSAVDWKQSPFARSMDSDVDNQLAERLDADSGDLPSSDSPSSDSKFSETGADGYAGGDTRFQVMARVSSLTTGLGVNLKVDIPQDDLTIASWIKTYPGANWHEREVFEMFGVSFHGHPKMRNLYLPTDFEGFPLRKDFPLVARMVKPWPGIVDVEPMPEVNPETEAATASTTTAAATTPPAQTTPLGATTSNPEDGMGS